MLTIKDRNGKIIDQLDPKSREDVVRIVQEGKIPLLSCEEEDLLEAEELLSHVRLLFGRSSEAAFQVCHHLENLRVLD